MSELPKTEHDPKPMPPDYQEVLTDSYPLKQVTFSIRTPTGIHDLQLYLDRNQYTQNILWEHLIRNQLYEMETLQWVSQILKPGDLFLDVGAHIGFFSLIASKWVGPQGKVVAVEPEPSNVAHFRKNIELNRIDNIDLLPIAVGAEEKETDFFINSDNDGGHALWDVARHPHNEKSRREGRVLKVHQTTLDRLIRGQLPRKPRLIKIDTEGAECFVVRGGTSSLTNLRIPYVICEINRFGMKQMGSTEKELRGFMRDLGYDPYLLSNQSPGLQKLAPDFFIESAYVFNLLFARDNPLPTN
jgi:FkbM family methyltransferase